jgi:class 3 adenylate cyclase/predicted ATPase
MCSGCGSPAREGANFCSQCGAPLEAQCAACGNPVEPADAFCIKCGARQGWAGAPVETGSGVPTLRQRRRVSVLFCDLVGYTALAEGRDPEETRELLSGYFDLAKAVVGRHGGVIEKFIGDAVMAVWGAPTAHEDDAERAVRAGLEMVDSVAAYGRGRALELQARVGVASGPVATVESLDEGLVVGDRVNLAARVQTAAPPGCCYVDELTQRLAEAAIAFEDAGRHPLKGFASPVPLYRALRVVSGIGGRELAAGLEAPLIGRDMELRTVKDLFHASAERSAARLVVVSGPAGIGKSRVAWELDKYLDGLVETVLWHRGRCLSYGDGVSYWALADMIRQRLAIAEEDPTEVAAAKMSEGLIRFVPEGERSYVGRRVARLLGVDEADDRAVGFSREELFAGWRLFFERLAGVAPVVLIVEDAQYADDGLVAFLDYLVDWARNLPIYVLVLARPEMGERYPRFGVGRNRTALSLDVLDDGSMRALVASLVPGLPDAAIAAVVSRAQGIPLFAVEMVRSLLDDQVLARTADGVAGYRLVRDPERLDVPDSLHGLLAARLDALDRPSRELAAVASVLGSGFAPEALVAVSGRDLPDVTAALAQLVQRDVLQVTADPLSPQQGDYRFTQELLRQVAYDSLPRRQRKALHLAVAAHLRATLPRDGEQLADVIARHFLDALAAAPEDPDGEQIRSRAIAELERSASRASSAGAPERAATSYALAARHVREVDARWASGGAEPVARAARLWEKACDAAIIAGQYERAAEYAHAAGDCSRQAGNRRGEARAAALLARSFRHTGRLSEARSSLRQAVEILRDDPDADTVEALGELAVIETFVGNLGDGDRLSAEALELAQAIEVDEARLAGLLTVRAITLGFLGRRAESAAFLKEAASVAEAAGATEELSRATLNLSAVLAGFDAAGSASAARTSMDHARRVGAGYYLVGAACNLAMALIELGEWDEVDRLLADTTLQGVTDGDLLSFPAALLAALRGQDDRLAEISGTITRLGREDVESQSFARFFVALGAHARGDATAALAGAMACLEDVGHLGYVDEAARWAWPLAARTAERLGDTTAFERLVEMIQAHPPGHLPPALRAERDLALLRTGRAEDPLLWQASVAALRQSGHAHALATGLVDYALYLQGRGEAGAAGAVLDEARTIAARLGAVPLLERVDQLSDRDVTVG